MRTITFIHNTCLLSDNWSVQNHHELISAVHQLLISCSLSLSLSTFLESLAHKPVTVHLVHETDIDYQCPICTEPLTEPYLSIECGHHLCWQCRDRLLSIGKTECPTCREPDVLTNAILEKYLQRVVKSLKVRCSDYKEGCEWVGELRDLHDHLDPAKGRCGIACPFGCGKYGRRSEMREHSRRHCHKRMISCENCSYYNKFTIVTEKHYPICPRSPIDCPNQHCPVEGLRRHQLEQHLNECSHQLVDCPNTGCSVKLPRGEMKLHTLQQHNKLLEETNQAVAIIPATVSPQYLYNQAPMEFIISDFSEKKEANEEWYSSPFYTHNRGYKFRLQVYPNGYGIGRSRDTHISVYAQLMRGEYDNELEWPFEVDIRVELVNWRADKNHHSDTIPFNRYSSSKFSSRVFDQETATGFGNSQFISHTDLAPTTNTEYLRDNYLKLRVSAIVYSTHLLSLTPAWQDSLSTTQSGAQFTISQYSKRKQFNNEYFSPPFTTSPQGYRLCLRVYANGYSSGKGSHLSIYAYIMKGQHDDRLQWPFTGTFIFELLNWLEDKEHYKMTLPIDTNNDFVRVTEREYGKVTGYHQFISQSSLNSSTNPQYLYQDCIRVRVQAMQTITNN